MYCRAILIRSESDDTSSLHPKCNAVAKCSESRRPVWLPPDVLGLAHQSRDRLREPHHVERSLNASRMAR